MHVSISLEQLPDNPHFSDNGEHAQFAQLYADAVDPELHGRSHWDAHFEDLKKAQLLVARAEQRIAGIALYDARPFVDAGLIVSRLNVLATAPPYRSQRIVGPALLDATIELAITGGAQAIEVQTDNERAVAFYERHSFETIVQNPFYTLLRRSL